MPSCESCIFWKKDYGIWAHNRWTRRLSDRGWCQQQNGRECDGRSPICPAFSRAPDKPDLFYSPTVPSSIQKGLA